MEIAETARAVIKMNIGLSDLEGREIEVYVEFRRYDSGVEKSRETYYQAETHYGRSHSK